MPRSYDDDAPRRIRNANELISARQRDADERTHVVTTNLVIDAREKLARRQRLDRMWRAGWAVSWLSLLTAVFGTGIAALKTSDPARFVVGDLICGSLLRLSVLVLVGVRFVGRGLPILQRAEAQLASARSRRTPWSWAIWWCQLEARSHTPSSNRANRRLRSQYVTGHGGFLASTFINLYPVALSSM